MTNQTKGIIFACIAAVISGISIFVNKFAVGAIQPPLVFTATKNSLVGLVIISFILMVGKWQNLKTINRKQVAQLILVGLIGGALPFYLFFTGLSQTSAINGALIQKTLVLWVAILAIPLLKERLKTIQIAAVLLLFGANVFVGGFAGFTYSLGELMILAATILWAIEHVIAKKALANLDPDLLVAARMGLGSGILLLAASIAYPQSLTHITQLSSTQWLWLLATVGLLLGYTMTWYRGIKYVQVTTVAAILVSATLITNVLSAIFITHLWNWQMGLQAIIMICALFLVVKTVLKIKPDQIINTTP